MNLTDPFSQICFGKIEYFRYFFWLIHGKEIEMKLRNMLVNKIKSLKYEESSILQEVKMPKKKQSKHLKLQSNLSKISISGTFPKDIFWN